MFNALYFCIFSLFYNKWGQQKIILLNLFFLVKLVVKAKQLNIINKNISSILLYEKNVTLTNILFLFLYINFLKHRLSLHTNQKILQYYLKAEGRSISEHPGIITQQKIVWEPTQCSLTAPTNQLFTQFLEERKKISPSK